MKLDEKRVRFPHQEGDILITERDLNPYYDTRISIADHIGVAGEILTHLPPKEKTMKGIHRILLLIMIIILFTLILAVGLYWMYQLGWLHGEGSPWFETIKRFNSL